LADVAERRVIAFSPPEARTSFAGIVHDRYELVAQSDGNLGQRMLAFFVVALAWAERVVLIGSDAPDLPRDRLSEAFDALERNDVVLGPAADGGYYLLGLARRIPRIFEGIAWGGPDVFQQTTRRLSAAGIRWHELPPWYDVDEPADLAALRKRLREAAGGGSHLSRLATDIDSLMHKAGVPPSAAP
jgi:rSAM/selenodomain-associated transferase 1